jgi:hypothetical protein
VNMEFPFAVARMTDFINQEPHGYVDVEPQKREKV